MEDQNVKEKVKIFNESEKKLNSATWAAGNYSMNGNRKQGSYVLYRDNMDVRFLSFKKGF
jgi:hypothetical protein